MPQNAIHRRTRRMKKEPFVLGQENFAAICAVEGLKFTGESLRRISSRLSTEERRAEVLKAFPNPKGRK
jgi:hypothetical protein